MEEEDHHIHTNIFASMNETKITYPDIDYNPNFDSLLAYGGIEEHKKGNNFPATNSLGNQENDQIDDDSKGDERKYFSFESPVSYGVQAYGGIEEPKKGNNFPATNNLLSQENDQIEDADSKGNDRKYFPYDSPVSYGVQAYGGIEEHKKGCNFPGTNNLLSQENDQIEDADNKGDRKYFSYELPVSEETGVWIPVSVPPMSESVREDWNKGLCLAGANFSDCDWDQFGGEEKEMTMWDVVLDMLLVAQGKVTSLASGDVRGYAISWMSDCILEQAWKEMAQTLTEANFGNTREILETEPPKWLADSAASACMLCSVRFHPIMCSRHHCRFCGGIFCNNCSRGRSLLPVKFRTGDPKRVCDVCCVRLESVQPYLIDQVSRASQVPTRDLTDLSTLRSWLNFPWGQSMEHEIYKATNAIRGYIKVGSLTPEKSIPESILKQAKGLAILTIAKVGMVMTYNIGTGLVVARRGDGSWSPPSAISTCGVGWGAQAGGEVTDFIIVLRNSMAVQTFGGNMHFSVGAGLSAAVGVVGRAAEADLRAGDGGYAACYTYSCSKGAFVGCSLEGSVVTTRAKENSRFYGNSSIKASDILLGLMPRPPAAAILYHALSDLYRRIET